MDKRYNNVKRPTVTLSTDEHKAIEHYRVDLDMKIGEYLKEAALYCLENKIDPRKRQKKRA